MSYQASGALQTAIFEVLSNDAGLQTQLAGAVYDAPPEGVVPDLYVLLGEERALDRSTNTGTAAVYDFVITVRTDGAGFLRAKQVSEDISDLLVGSTPAMTRGDCRRIQFRNARARRINGDALREIVMTFRAYIDEI